MALIFDTETSGLPLSEKGYGYFPLYTETAKYDTSRVVQVSYIIADENYNKLEESDTIIKRDGFKIENHQNLFGLIHILTNANKKIMLSNSDVSLVRENFTNEHYKTSSILCKRSINSKNPEAKAKEVIIKNY